MSSLSGVRIVAAFEAAKGVLVVLAGLGLFAALGEGAQLEAEEIVRHFHLNPARHTSRVFVAAAADVSNQRLMALAALAMLYAVLRLAEAYGLWFDKRWAEWLAALSGGIYLPFEAVALARGVTPLRVALTTINAAVVAYMAWRLASRRAT
jgi:uncharacterized membrane protein (DUF2068 family)